MAKLEIIIDASLIIKAYRQGLEDAFILIKEEFPALEKELNINRIQGGETED